MKGQVEGDLLALLRIFRDGKKLFWWVTGLCLLGSLLLLGPPIWTIKSRPSAGFVSTASLLVTRGVRWEFSGVFARTGKNELDFWLVSPTLFRLFLDNQKVDENVELWLRQRNPRLVPLARTISVELVFSQSDSPLLIAIQGRESNIEIQEMEEKGKLQETARAQRILVRALARRPEDAQILARAMVAVLQKALEKVATQKVTAQRKAIEGYLRVGALKQSRVLRALTRSKSSSPLRIRELLRRKETIGAEYRQLRNEVEDLQEQALSGLGAKAGSTASDGSVREKLEGAQQEAIMAGRLYAPDSAMSADIRNRLDFYRRLSQQSDRLALERGRAAVMATIQAKRKLMSQASEEMTLIDKSLARPAQVTHYKHLEQQLAAWETEELGWQQKLIQTRIEERLSKGDGTTILLQPPLPGNPVEKAVWWQLPAFRHLTFALGIAPFLGVLAVFVRHLISDKKAIVRNAQFYLDAPILAEVTMPRRKGPT